MASVLDTPLVLVVMGCTGAGKTLLGVELAKRFNGEVISADALQVYTEMPVATNRATAEEMEGVPHHLLACMSGVSSPPFNVIEFRQRADELIASIQARGKVAIIVGGTHYYIFSLLFRSLLHDSADADADADDADTDGDADAALPTADLYARLTEIDPVMADKLHPNDRRKILRSLQVFRFFGRPHSALLADQRRDPADTVRHRSLMFNLYADPDALGMRLDRRVDAMVMRGLKSDLLDFRAGLVAGGRAVDATHGLTQAIGYKEFLPWFEAREGGQATQEEIDDIESKCISSVKRQTRTYAASQQSWVRAKMAPAVWRISDARLCSIVSLDTTDAGRFSETVVEKAVKIVQDALSGQFPPPADLPDIPETESGADSGADSMMRTKRTCDMCHVTVHGPKEWDEHVASRLHRRSRKRARVSANGDAAKEAKHEKQKEEHEEHEK